MSKKSISQSLFQGRDAVVLSVVWVGVYLFVSFLLETISLFNVLTMFIGLVVLLVMSIFIRNGW